ncbi:KAP family P-loop NTPase fold protein [Aeromonas veronii]|uniref:KAP family P-loop NTPase fold protein n=1 Tax=Aeromonas veronii TaxID=654 RepID=UPI0009B8B1A6|nr:P-loop NTPase fold protein [Aeromonas veronii]
MAVAPFNWDDAVQWDGPGAIAGCEESLSADRLERARYAEFLTNYLAAEGKQRNYVLNLNAEWGAGKTWFIKRWYMELKAHYPTVYIDAWQQDFSDDPLLTVISSIIDQLKMIAGKENPIPEGMRQRLLGLFKVGGKLALKAAIKKAGLEDEDFSLEGEEANQLVDALCSNQKERYESIQYLKNEIRQWVEGAVGLSEGELDYPAFILIDELDRCRPSYAVEMLETIKHIFDIPRVVFVLATDTEQLQHAIKVIYGDGFDAKAYLRRFFKRRFHLKQMPIEKFMKPILSNSFELFKEKAIQHLSDIDDLTKILSYVVSSFSLPAREVELFLDRLVATISSVSSWKIDILYVSSILMAHEFDNDTYISIKNTSLVFSPNKMTPEHKRADKISWLSKSDKISVIFYGFESSHKGRLIKFTCDGLLEYLKHVDLALQGNESVAKEYFSMKDGSTISGRYVHGGNQPDCDETYFKCAIYDAGKAKSDYMDLVEFSTLLK